MRITDSELGQIHVYRSESKGRLMIIEMSPMHALAAWRKLREEAGERWDPVVRRSPLAAALLKQALEEDILFAEDMAPAPLFLDSPDLDEDDLLERCFDGLAAIDALGHMHPVRRARVLALYLRDQKETT